MYSKLTKLSIGAIALLLAPLCSTLMSQQALAQVFTWNQGNDPIPMITERVGVCFLTSIQGKFEGSGEKVEVYKKNGRWFLGGSSDQFGVSGEANCVPWGQLAGAIPVANGPYTLNQSEEFRYLDGFTEGDGFCFLGGVSGKFRGGEEQVAVTLNPNREWVFDIRSQQFGVSASAYCIPTTLNYTKLTSQFTWVQDGPTFDLGSAYASCFLTGMTGKFQGSGEKVRVYSDFGEWYLGGTSNQFGVSASARCYRR